MGNVMLFHLNYVREGIFKYYLLNSKVDETFTLEEASEMLYFNYP